MNRRDIFGLSLLAAPAALVADTPAADRPTPAATPVRITRVEVLHLEKPLKERFWMANAPIGGFEPKASRLIVTIHTDAGISGTGEGAGGGADLFRKGFDDLIIGEDPFMVGRIREKMFAAMAPPVDAAIYEFMSKSAGLPVYKFLGGYRETVPV